MLNKPRGTVSACRDERHRTVIDLFPLEERPGLFPIGRLDMDTEGLLLITDDGKLFYHLMMPEHHVEKTYFFIATGHLPDESCERLRGGVNIFRDGGRVTAPATLREVRNGTLGDYIGYLDGHMRNTALVKPNLPAVSGLLTLTEGKKHQVKRMLLSVGCRVRYLRRVSIGALPLPPSLSPGEYRALTECEVASLYGISPPPDCHKPDNTQ